MKYEYHIIINFLVFLMFLFIITFKMRRQKRINVSMRLLPRHRIYGSQCRQR